MEIDSLRVQIVTAQTIREKKHYTIYEIEVRSSSTIAWFIWKRYSQVHEFHSALVKSLEKSDGSDKKDGKDSKSDNYSNNPTSTTSTTSTTSSTSTTKDNLSVGVGGKSPIVVLPSHLPSLPPKRMTRFMSMAPEFVEKRKNELQDYLSAIVAVPGILSNSQLLSFFEVPESVRSMLTTSSSSSSSKGPIGLDLKDLSPEIRNELKNFSNKSYDERRVHELVSILKSHPARVHTIKSFEDYFFDSRPRISAEMIRLLFQGRAGQENDGGLVQTCGDVRYSRVAATAALSLLVRLLDVEKNKDAQSFLDQFVSLDPSVLRRLKLDLHINNDRGNRLSAFRIISILKSARQSGQNDIDIDRIVGDNNALKEYKLWSERSSMQIGMGMGDSTVVTTATTTKFVKAPSLGEISSTKALSQSIIQDVLRINSDNTNWKIVRNVNTSLLFSFSPSQFDPNDPLNNIVISYKPQPSTAPDCISIKIVTVIPALPSDISKVLSSLSLRSQWDPKYISGRVLQQVDNECDIITMSFKSFISPYKFREMTVVRNICTHPNNSGGIIHCMRSVMMSERTEGGEGEGQGKDKNMMNSASAAMNNRKSVFPSSPISPSSPSSPSSLTSPSSPSSSSSTSRLFSTRAIMYPSAHLLEKIDHPDDYTLFTTIWQYDSESALLVTPDLLGESSEVRTSMWNLRNLVEKSRGSSGGVKKAMGGNPPQQIMQIWNQNKVAEESESQRGPNASLTGGKK